MSVIDAINQTSSSQKDATTTSGVTEYKSSDFMQLLLAQLSHQNPLEPMDDSEMMNQFTQLNSLQELQDIETAIQQIMQDGQSTYAASLIGKNVSINKPDGTSVEGVVTGFSTQSGDTYVQVEDQNYTIDEIVKVWEESVHG